MKIFYSLSFLPLVFYPFFRCYFEIPHVFCHVCPRRCIWGYIRPITIPAVLLINLWNRSWCSNYCPIGSLQDEQAKSTEKRINLPRILRYPRYLILALVIIVYFWILSARRNITDANLYSMMYKNAYVFSPIIFLIAIIIFVASFFVHRLWCNYFCPIGTASDVILKIENKVRQSSEVVRQN
jgi:polyferredoxin